MNKDLIETQDVKLAAHRFMAVQSARRRLERCLGLLEKSVPALAHDRMFDLAMNQRTPHEWAAMSTVARERIIAIEMGFRPVDTVRRRPKSSKRAGVYSEG